MNKRDTGIDFLKIIATFAVVGLHTQRDLSTGILFNPILYYISRFAMPVFFMCNGFLIFQKEDFTFEYFKKKILNILKLLASWSIVTMILSLLVDHDSLKQVVINGIKCFLGANIVPFWFFYTLIAIYFILLFLFKKIKKRINIVLLVLFLIMLIIDVISLIYIFNGGYFIQKYVDQRLRLWTWLFYFCLGYKLKTIENKLMKPSIGIVILIFISAFAVMYQIFLCYNYLGRINSEYCYDNILIVIWSSCVFSVFIRFKYKFSNLILSISKYSFGIFLLHGYFLHYFKLTSLVSNGVQSFVLWILLIVICFLISALANNIPYLNRMFKY